MQRCIEIDFQFPTRSNKNQGNLIMVNTLKCFLGYNGEVVTRKFQPERKKSRLGRMSSSFGKGSFGATRWAMKKNASCRPDPKPCKRISMLDRPFHSLL